MTDVRLDYKFIAKMAIQPKTFDAVLVKNLATKSKSYTPIIQGKPLRISWTTKSSAIEYAKRVFNRYRRLLKAQEECLEAQNELDT